MKNVRKLKNTVKAAAGSALLVGATLTGAAGLAAASSHTGGDSGSMDLGDYPHPFVNDDGEVDSTIVVGSQGRQSDVVGAINIAGSLGNSAYTTDEQSVSVEGSFGWSATDGVSLDTRNDQLHFGDTIDEVRQTLTEDQLDVLQTQEVLTGDAEQDVEQYLYLGEQEVDFGNPSDEDQDPFLYVNNPANPDNTDTATDYLYRLQANFQDGVEFEDDSDDNKNDDVYGEEITMFGTDYTVADSAFSTDNTGQLVLYGSSQDIDVSNGESSTVTVDGDEYTVETVAVTGTDAAAVRIDGTLEQVETNDEFDIGGETLRVDSIIDTGDNGAGVVQFAIGSEQVVLEDGEPVMTGSDEDEVDGTHVSLSLSGDGEIDGDSDVELSSIEIAVGAADSEEGFVAAGEAFEDPVFDDLQFHFGGINPDSADEDAEGVGQVEFSTSDDETATVSYSDGDNDATLGFAYDDSLGNDITNGRLGNEDGEMVVQEGAEAQEDDFVATDAGDFSHVWQVTNIDRDTDEGGDTEIESGDEATVELEDAVTGASVEANLDATIDEANFGASDAYYTGTEVIDGQEYHFELEGDSGSDPAFRVAWGTGSDVSTGSGVSDTYNSGNLATGRTSLYAAQDTDSGAAVAFYEPVSVEGDVELPSTDGTADVTHDGLTDGEPEVFDGGELTYSYGFVPLEESDYTASDSISPSSGSVTVAVNADGTSGNTAQVDGTLLFADGDTGSFSVTEGGSEDVSTDSAVIGVATTNFGTTPDDAETLAIESNVVEGDLGSNALGADSDIHLVAGGDQVTTPAAAVMEPEDDSDREDTYLVAPGVDTDDEELDVAGSDAAIGYTGGYSPETLDSDDDVQVSYSTYGTYTEQDTEDQGSFTLNIPSGQASAGAAVTGNEGSLEASAGGSGTVETNTPTGWPDAAQLDENVDTESASNLIMVGGPAVNTLVSDLADENKTWTADQYEEDTWVLDMVEGFSSGQHALVVAGYGAEDTRAASEFLANYQDNADELAGETRVSMETQ